MADMKLTSRLRATAREYGHSSDLGGIYLEAASSIEQLVEALELAKEFIQNGVEFGFIRIPNDKDDSASQIIPRIDAALASAKGTSE